MDIRGLTFSALALAALVVLAVPGPTGRRLRAVQRRDRLPVSEAASTLLHTYLRRTRRGRSAGVMLAASALSFALYAWFAVDELADTETGPFTPFALAVLLLGYLAGSALSELTWVAAPSGRQRAATLRARCISTYLPAWVTALQRALAAAAVVLSVALVLLVDAFSTTWVQHVRSWSWGAVLACGVVAVAGAAELGQRRVSARPQSWTDIDTVRVDDAIRAWSQRNLAGAALGIQLLLLGQLAIQVLLRLGDVTHHPGIGHRVYEASVLGYVLLPAALVALLWRRLSVLPLGGGQGGPGADDLAQVAGHATRGQTR